ncbi:hypothetical protein HPB48_017869 [Haemaphysalis longicornis]|uniref:Uncharacterized protein n=1 Tax=Haemaphysalis longicornis TaxID=44386 RepID=A0A9J6GMI5_HAELO|nr:hypothetical protein HPB48_017869 [Haemaphysalis longicornis]
MTPRVKEPVAAPALNTTRRNSTTTLFGIANMEQTNGVVLRAFYVIVGVMMIILVYFVVRIVSRRRRSALPWLQSGQNMGKSIVKSGKRKCTSKPGHVESLEMIKSCMQVLQVSRYRRSKTRRYGIIATHSAELEMQPLDRADDEEEETTLFEAGKR